jgi:antibiotic biosynthesis monooxygenase (ABM) superfamily enzyme
MNTMDKQLTYQGATVVITHRVREDKHAEYEIWLGEIVPLCKASPGHLDWHIVRPISGLTETYRTHLTSLNQCANSVIHRSRRDLKMS